MLVCLYCLDELENNTETAFKHTSAMCHEFCCFIDRRTEQENQSLVAAAYMYSSVQAIPAQTSERSRKSWCGKWTFIMVILENVV